MRPSPENMDEATLGFVKKGSVVEVEGEVVEGAKVDLVARWYKDPRGWYYWGGAVEEIPEEEEIEVKEELIFEKKEELEKEEEEGLIEPSSTPSEFEKKNRASKGRKKEEEEAAPPVPEGEGGESEPSEEEEVNYPQIPEYLRDDWEAMGQKEHSLPGEVAAEEKAEQKKPTRYPASSKLNWSILHLGIDWAFWDKGITGKGIRVGILDTGIDEGHLLFSNIEIKGRNFSSDNANDIEDTDGQGTRNAGLIAARGDKEKDRIGVAPGIELYVGKIMSSASDGPTFDSLWQGIEWALEMQVKILFIGAAMDKADLDTEQQEELFDLGELVQEKGAIMIAPAGDTDNPLPVGRYPACLDTCLSVGGFDKYRRRYPKTAYSFSLDVMAPGKGLRTADIADGIKDGYKGTSAAAAFTTGVMALLLEYLRSNSIPSCSPGKMIALMKASAGMAGIPWSRIRSYEYGFGQINPVTFIRMSKEKKVACP